MRKNSLSTPGNGKILLFSFYFAFALSFLLFALYLGTCALPMGLDYLTGGNEGVESIITGEDLQRFIPAPVTGDEPRSQFNAGRYSGAVAWTDGEGGDLDGAFIAGTAYAATVTLSAHAGYSFKAPAAPNPGSFTHSRSEELSHAGVNGPTLEITLRFRATPEKDYTVEVEYNLQRYVPVPVTGDTPVTDLSQPNLALTVQWQDARGANISAPAQFEGGTQYGAIITLWAQGSYLFNKNYAFTYPEGTVQTPPALQLEELDRVLSVVYHPTAAPLAVTDLDLAPHISAPGTEERATWSIVAPQYMGTVAWELHDPESDPATWTAMPGALFQPGATYRAVITLYAAAGYTLKDVAFFHSGGTIDDSGTTGASVLTGLKIAFPKTAGAPPEPVTDRNLTIIVPAPVADEIPVWYFTVPQYTGRVQWDPEPSGSFLVNRPYTAQVTLRAAQGRTFKGMPGTFVHDKADPAPALQPNPETTVDNERETAAVITIAFPPATEPPFKWGVSNPDLTNKVFVPEAGATPATWVETNEYGGWVEWYAGDHTPHTGTFVSGVAYTAEIRLMASSGNTFYDNDGSLTLFIHTGVSYEPKDISTSSRQIILIIIDFEETK
jgi:hypothetical protein